MTLTTDYLNDLKPGDKILIWYHSNRRKGNFKIYLTMQEGGWASQRMIEFDGLKRDLSFVKPQFILVCLNNHLSVAGVTVSKVVT